MQEVMLQSPASASHLGGCDSACTSSMHIISGQGWHAGAGMVQGPPPHAVIALGDVLQALVEIVEWEYRVSTGKY